MNPGYAGSTELSDNLKVLFKPCAMMVPDFVFISEILLFSGGFKSATQLAVELVAPFDLCRKQLSKAYHYDWGLCAMKAILTTAGKLKRANFEEYEPNLLFKAIRDCTIPRLVSIDIQLFDSKKSIDSDLEKVLIRAFQELKRQATPQFLMKCNEIYETTVVRHGFMLVGGAIARKTKCCTT